MAKKIIGVENLNVIRDFVLSKIMTESDDIRRTLTEENAEYLHNKLLEASESLKTDYESKYEHLNNRIDTLKSEGANAEELREIELQIDALNNNYADMQNGLSAIEDSIIDIENSVMSPGQLNELIDTALIERTTITEDMVSTPNVYTQNIVALIAKFGTVRALNIVGDEIQGKTISAYDKISGTDEPTWKLDRQGNGYLANKNISWDKDGNVTFGENVKIGWGSVTDTPDDFGSGISIFTSTVFTRNNEKPSKPTGGSYSKPTPDESVWTDGIPDGDMILWASTRVFASDGGSKQQIHWSEPAQMTDTATFDVEFSSVITNPGNPTDNPDNWSNDGTTDTIWMATRTISNGETSDWIITKIKGEDGKDGKDGVDGVDGKDGTSISIAGTFATEDELKAAYPDGPDPVTNAYVVGTDLYVWANGQWKNVGQFTGKDGVNGKDGADGKDGAQVYLHIKYAESIAYDLDGKTVVSVDWTDDDGEVRGPYQGMYSDYVKESSMDFTKYNWFQIDAEKAVQTEFGKYKITSNTIAGKTIHSTTEIPLEDGTTFETFNDDGLSLGTTTSDGTTEGPAWQLRNLGDGYLAKGNIRWDAAGNVEFGPNVTIGWNDEWDEKIPDIPEGGLTETDVNNIISTKITKDYVESLEVRAKDIIGDTIQGKTIKSDTGAWEITKTGAGHLANNNISWDEDGNLNATISGTFDGGSDGSLAGGAITWDDSTVHIHKNFEFDNGVGISWNNISNTENIAYKTDIPDVGGYVTEDRVTEITDSKISTLEIDASKIKSGTIDTERLNVDNLEVRRLNTTGATTGKRIVIEGNTISVYNSGNKVTCQLSNLSMGNLDIYDVLQSSSNITINNTGTPSIGMYIPTTSYGNSQRTLSGSAVQKTTIGVLQPGATLKIGGSFKLTGVKHSGANVTYQMNYEIRIYKDDVLIKTLTDSAGTSGISPTSSATISASIPETTYNITEAGTYAYASYVTGWWMPTSISSTGDMYCETKTANVVGSCNTYSSDVKATSYIYEDGVIFKNMNGGFAINKDAVAMKCDNAQVVLKDGDIYMAFDGQSTPKKVVPRTYKFRLAGDRNQTMCVLTFGDVIDGE